MYGELFGRAAYIAGMIDYQEGAVVSKTLLSKPEGNVTLFSFEQGQGLSEHTAPFDAMVVVVEGEAEVIISGISNSVRAGQMIIMPANKPHAINAISKFKMLLIMIRSR